MAGNLGFKIVMGRYTEKPNRYRIFWKSDTDIDVGIWKTENTEKPTKKPKISDISVLVKPHAVAVLHMHNCTLHNALKNVVELIKCNA